MLPIKIQLPPGFLDEEIRCDYLVTSEMKKIWAVEIDILLEVKRICDKYSIKWFTAGGTTLGAIRHEGFIPWDDDIDILMLREDYDRFCEIGPKEFTQPYFYQDYKTDPYCLHGHVQIRNSKTTAILKGEFKNGMDYNQGIFVDIFPLDNIPSNDQVVKAHILKALSFKTKANTEMYQARFKSSIPLQKNIFKFAKDCILTYYRRYMFKKFKIYPPYLSTYKKFLSMMETWNEQETENVTCMSLTYTPRYIMKKEWFNQPVLKKFEWFELPVPIGYEEYLNQTIGDWRKHVIGGSMHGGVIFDVERPYTYYL